TCAKRAIARRVSSSVAFGWSGLPTSEVCQGGENGMPFVFNIRYVAEKSTRRAFPRANSYFPFGTYYPSQSLSRKLRAIETKGPLHQPQRSCDRRGKGAIKLQ